MRSCGGQRTSKAMLLMLILQANLINWHICTNWSKSMARNLGVCRYLARFRPFVLQSTFCMTLAAKRSKTAKKRKASCQYRFWKLTTIPKSQHIQPRWRHCPKTTEISSYLLKDKHICGSLTSRNSCSLEEATQKRRTSLWRNAFCIPFLTLTMSKSLKISDSEERCAPWPWWAAQATERSMTQRFSQ